MFVCITYHIKCGVYTYVYIYIYIYVYIHMYRSTYLQHRIGDLKDIPGFRLAPKLGANQPDGTAEILTGFARPEQAASSTCPANARALTVPMSRCLSPQDMCREGGRGMDWVGIQIGKKTRRNRRQSPKNIGSRMSFPSPIGSI